jgi:hypothetical protein
MNKALKNQLLWAVFAVSLSVVACGQRLAPQPTELNRLQGYWEGDGAGGKCSITIKDDSLFYRAGTNWWKTTFTLPAGTNPQQLHATIKDSLPPSKDSVGTVVYAIIKIEGDTLTLALFDKPEEPLKTFEDAATKYVVKKTPPKKEEDKAPKGN